MADRDEQSGRVERAEVPGHRVAQDHAGELVVALERGHLGVPGELDLGVGERPLLHDLGGAELVAAVHEGDLGAEAGQERRLLDRGVAAADDGDVLLAEEEAVAGRAPADAVAGEPVLVRDAELAVARAHGQDHGACGERAVLGAHRLERRPSSSTEMTSSETSSAPKRSAWARISSISCRALDAVAEAGEVLDLGGVHQRSAGGHRALEHEGCQVGAGGVDRGRVAGRAGADDDHVAGVCRTRSRHLSQSRWWNRS